MYVNITGRGSSGAVCRHSVILDGAAPPGGPAVGSVAIEQSGNEIGFRILADSAAGRSVTPRTMALGEALNLDLYCDPSGDRIVIVNPQTVSIAPKSFEAGQDENSVVVRPAIELNPSTPTFPGPGSWGFFAKAEELRLLDLSILPRQYVTVTAVEAEAQGRQSSKRAFEASRTWLKVCKSGRTNTRHPRRRDSGQLVGWADPLAFIKPASHLLITSSA